MQGVISLTLIVFSGVPLRVDGLILWICPDHLVTPPSYAFQHSMGGGAREIIRSSTQQSNTLSAAAWPWD